jgi:hypothetical protein
MTFGFAAAVVETCCTAPCRCTTAGPAGQVSTYQPGPLDPYPALPDQSLLSTIGMTFASAPAAVPRTRDRRCPARRQMPRRRVRRPYTGLASGGPAWWCARCSPLLRWRHQGGAAGLVLEYAAPRPQGSCAFPAPAARHPGGIVEAGPGATADVAACSWYLAGRGARASGGKAGGRAWRAPADALSG